MTDPTTDGAGDPSPSLDRFGAAAAAPGVELCGRPDVAAWHGVLCAGERWPLPALAASSDAVARPKYAPTLASEFLDTPEVLEAKCRLIARMMQVRRGLR